jgi:hypothetical protein
VDHPRFHHRLARGETWIERRRRVLEDDLHPPPRGTQIPRPERAEVDAREGDGSLVGFEEPHRDATERRLPGSGLTDEPVDLPLAHHEVDPVDHSLVAGPGARGEALPDAAEVEERRVHDAAS